MWAVQSVGILRTFAVIRVLQARGDHYFALRTLLVDVGVESENPVHSPNGNTHAEHMTMSQVTQLLQAASSGDPRASNELLPLVYQELRKLAHSNMQGEAKAGAGHTLQPTALVHEAFLRLVGNEANSWNSRGHFFGAAALAMRRILVDRARARNAKKRGGGNLKLELREDAVAGDIDEGALGDLRAAELIALDGALEKLKELDERAAQIVMLRYFAGLSVEQTAAALDLSPATIKKSWAFARAWLGHEISKDTGE